MTSAHQRMERNLAWARGATLPDGSYSDVGVHLSKADPSHLRDALVPGMIFDYYPLRRVFIHAGLGPGLYRETGSYVQHLWVYRAETGRSQEWPL